MRPHVSQWTVSQDIPVNEGVSKGERKSFLKEEEKK